MESDQADDFVNPVIRDTATFIHGEVTIPVGRHIKVTVSELFQKATFRYRYGSNKKNGNIVIRNGDDEYLLSDQPEFGSGTTLIISNEGRNAMVMKITLVKNPEFSKSEDQ